MVERKELYKMINEKTYKYGYTQGTFDMFHIGHLNLLKNAKANCEYLIVGVNKDDLVKEYKNKIPVISEKDRMEIIKSIKYVDEVILVSTLDKMRIYEQYKYDAIFIGDDWKGSERWNKTEEELKNVGVDVVYLAYTKGVCSTDLRKQESKKVEE